MRSRRFSRRLPPPRTSVMTRIIPSLGMLVLLGMMIQRAGDPATWAWLAPQRDADEAMVDNAAPAKIAAAKDAAPEPAKWTETIRPGPTDEAEGERAAFDKQAALITDKRVLAPEEMPAYWHLLKWADAVPSTELKRRSRKDPLYTQLWEAPARFRGKLVSLRLDIRRVLIHDAPDNKAGYKQVYEAWGFTEESMAHPYVIVFSDLPPGFVTRGNVQQKVNFTGYFLKIMRYEAQDKKVRGAPLLVGRIQVRGKPAVAPQKPRDNSWWYVSAGAVFVAWIFIRWRLQKRVVAMPILPSTEPTVNIEEWLATPQLEPEVKVSENSTA